MRVQSGYDLQSSQKLVKSNLHTKIRCSLSVNGLRRFFVIHDYTINKNAINILNRYTCSDTLFR